MASGAIRAATLRVAPVRLAWWIILLAMIGGMFGLVVHTRDWYRDLKRYVRERDEFCRRLRERS